MILITVYQLGVLPKRIHGDLVTVCEKVGRIGND
jgi:hypothetical protein